MDLTTINLKPYVDFKVHAVVTIKGKYGFRVTVVFDDLSEKTCQHAGFEKKALATKEREHVIALLHEKKYVVYKNVRVSEFLEYWLEYIMRPRESIAANTYNSYRNCINKHINPKIGKLKLINLNKGHIIKLYKDLSSYKSIPKIAKPIMNTSLQFALSKNLIQFNPCTDVALPKEVKKGKFHTVEINSQNTYSLEQVKMIIGAAKHTGIYMQMLFALLLGMRRSEINGVKYSDIDYENKTLTLSRQLGEDLHADPKTITRNTKHKQEIKMKTPSSYRTVDIPDFVLAEILKERKRYEKNRSRRQTGIYAFQDLDYIVCSTCGRPRCKAFHYPHYKKLIEKELKLPYIKFHDLRHTYTTLLLKSDINQKAVAMALGHANSIITVDVYTDKMAIIEDSVKDIQAFIYEVHPFDETDFMELEKLEYLMAM